MIVIKVGGSRGINYDRVCADLSGLYQRGEKFVLVHGGSYETNLLSEKLGKPPRFVTSASGYESRFTDRETLEIFSMIYCGKMNTAIVEKLQALGVKAIGLSGVDGRLLEGVRKASVKIIENGKRRILHGDYTGKVERVNTELIHLLAGAGYVLVVSPPAISFEGEAINVDGDRAAAKIAEALKADKLIILSNVPGLLRDVADESSLVPHIIPSQLDSYMEIALGRMKKKIMAAGEALAAGVGEVVLADARIEQPILRAVAGQGTVIKA
ncbi:MAG: [LysW]-aminoadipate kinase [Acidobacteria bacterium]|nr:[LysW]-aminoadipate kinase [Acidobacteriota bacterium]MBI3656992.1 [LysW]-aminoadipate kinase [Acidobacteriota bacterium]